MSKTIIGIAGNKQALGSGEFFGTTTAYTPEGFVHGVNHVGGLPLILPIGKPELAEAYVSQIDKLLLAGGQDVSPQLYQEEPHLLIKQTDLERDLFEKALIEAAVSQEKPIFAVCRGMQLLNVVFGGSLYQDLSLFPEWQINHLQIQTHPIFPSHSVTVKENSTLAGLIGTEAMVNSYHHQGIKKLAPGFDAVAHSKDHLIEGIEAVDKPIMGVQWHPELSFQANEKDLSLFDYFVNHL